MDAHRGCWDNESGKGAEIQRTRRNGAAEVRTKSVCLSRHSVTGGVSTGHDVAISRLENTGGNLASIIGPLLTLDDGEVVVGEEAA